MILTRLELSNFRNYERQDIEFSEGRNIITGRNAQGKSNLLEAIYFLSHLRSNRAPRLRELLMNGEDQSSVRGMMTDDGDRLNLRIAFGPQGRSVELNGQRVESTARARGILKCVLFAPDDLYLVKGDPGRRREFLDETMEELGPIPASTVQQYRHVLRQRNALLKRWEEHGANLAQALAPWTEALTAAGAAMKIERLEMLKGVQATASETYKAISGEEKDLELEYVGSFEDAGETESQIVESMREALERGSSDEKKARTTIVGPHRDDVEIRLGGRKARFTASQGEQRTIAFCLRVAQKRYLRERTGKAPVLLLDDVLSELDERRRGKVLELVGVESQAIITTTELPGSIKGPGDRVFVVEEGRVTVA